jgi:hypothetical protein
MAERFGGKFSPDAQPKGPSAEAVRQAAAEDRRVDAAGARANLLFLPAALLAVFSLGAGPVGLVVGLAGAAVLTLAAWLLREGLRAEAAYNARTVARRPAMPRKMLASALTGLGVALAAWEGGDLLGPVLYGIAAAGLHVAAFGIDPLRDKGMAGVDTFQQERVARVVGEAEGYLTSMREQIAQLGDRTLDARVATFQALARKMIRTVEEDPRDLTEARKFLTVYLMGARDASVKFAEVWKRNRDPQARADYEALLTDLETNFAARTEKMLEGGKEDLDIEIKVLRDRLQREGVRPGQGP